MYRLTSLQNKAGFTLVELLVAMVIMLVGLMGLLQSVNIATEYNLKNQMRTEVTRIAQDNMNAMRSRPFDSVSAVATSTVATQLRNINRLYNVQRSRFRINSSSSTYQVDVTWQYKNVPTTHSVMSVRSRSE